MHYQKNPFAQGKLVRCTYGEIFDVAVDIRANSPTFGKWVGEYLTAENKKQLWVPSGFAHGFLCLSKSCAVYYKCTNYRDKNSEQTIKWNDKDLKIKWPKEKFFLSNKQSNIYQDAVNAKIRIKIKEVSYILNNDKINIKNKKPRSTNLL